MKRDAFNAPCPRTGVISGIKREAPRHAWKSVFLSFTCDIYQPINDEYQLARQAIEALHAANCGVTILTKGGYRSLNDLYMLVPDRDKYGATLTFINPSDSLEWEPNAAPPDERIEVLAKAKSRGIQTWASLEPVIYPEQSLELIKATAGIVDFYKLGRWNHDKRANEIDWRDFAIRAVAACEAQGSKYMLKKDLAKYLPVRL